MIQNNKMLRFPDQSSKPWTLQSQMGPVYFKSPKLKPGLFIRFKLWLYGVLFGEVI